MLQPRPPIAAAPRTKEAAVALSKRTLDTMRRNPAGIPIGQILCVAGAALEFYACWKASESDKCVKKLVADIERCLK